MLKMVCFDLDGTIADTLPLCIEAFRKAVSPYAGHLLSDKEIIQTFGMNEIGMVKAVTGSNWKQALEEFYICYESMHHMCTEPFQGIRGLIEELGKRNIVVTMITGKGLKCCDISFNKLQLNHLFCECITGLEKGENKTNQILFLLEKYNLQTNEFVYIGDTVSDVISCNNAKVQCLSAAWANSADCKALNALNLEFVFTDIADLRKFLIDKMCESKSLSPPC